jgi:DNA-binding response OmpR family regulator
MHAMTVDVVTLRWPTEEMRRRVLADAGVPRLLVVEGEQSPPTDLDELEDWIRVPALEMDRRARVERLRTRLAGSEPRQGPPTIDEDGLVHVGPSWVSVPPVEARLAAVLIEHFGAVVSRPELSSAAWPGGAAQRNALDVRILRLRRRIEDLGLAIKTVRSRGYLMEWSVSA